jgi:hypothetical protein
MEGPQEHVYILQQRLLPHETLSQEVLLDCSTHGRNYQGREEIGSVLAL